MLAQFRYKSCNKICMIKINDVETAPSNSAFSDESSEQHENQSAKKAPFH